MCIKFCVEGLCGELIFLLREGFVELLFDLVEDFPLFFSFFGVEGSDIFEFEAYVSFFSQELDSLLF